MGSSATSRSADNRRSGVMIDLRCSDAAVEAAVEQVLQALELVSRLVHASRFPPLSDTADDEVDPRHRVLARDVGLLLGQPDVMPASAASPRRPARPRGRDGRLPGVSIQTVRSHGAATSARVEDTPSTITSRPGSTSCHSAPVVTCPVPALVAAGPPGEQRQQHLRAESAEVPLRHARRGEVVGVHDDRARHQRGRGGGEARLARAAVAVDADEARSGHAAVRRSRPTPRPGTPGAASDRSERRQQQVGHRRARQHRVEPVHQSTVAGQQVAHVLDAEVALDHRLAEITEGRGDADGGAEEQAFPPRLRGR